jgi:hypothetical protein
MRIAALPPPKDFSKDLDKQIDANRVEALVLTPDQFMSVLKDKTAHDERLEYNVRLTLHNTVFGQYWNKNFYPNVNEPAVLPLGQVAADLYALTHTLRALGVIGTQVYTKTANDKTYLIFKGYPGLRNLVKGTRFLTTNPQIVQLGLGVRGAANVAKGGFVLGLVVTTGIEITDFILNDQKTMFDLVGSIGYEAVKSGVVAGLALGAGLAIGSFISVAVLPLSVMVFMACAIGVGLNILDNQYDVKKKVLNGLKTLPDDVAQGLYRLKGSTLEQIDQVKANLDRKIQEAERQVNKAIDRAAAKAAELAIEALREAAMQAIKQLLSPR